MLMLRQLGLVATCFHAGILSAWRSSPKVGGQVHGFAGRLADRGKRSSSAKLSVELAVRKVRAETMLKIAQMITELKIGDTVKLYTFCGANFCK